MNKLTPALLALISTATIAPAHPHVQIAADHARIGHAIAAHRHDHVAIPEIHPIAISAESHIAIITTARQHGHIIA